LIRIEQVKKSFGKKQVLQGVTLEVSNHELLSLVGPSGCGKTTTLNVVAGLCQPDEGSVTIDDTLLDGRRGDRLVHVNPSDRKVGYVFQEYALFPHMTVSDNISYGLRARHWPQKELKERTQKLLQFVGLVDHAQHYPPELSGGQKQRIALARALAIEPNVLLLDEPLAALDPRTRETLRADLKKMLGTLEVTSIYVTHELTEAYTMSDRIAVMGPGRIQQTGHRDEIFLRPNSAFVAQFLGENVLSGRIISTSSSPTIAINGVEIFARIPSEANEKVLVTLRPEDIALTHGSSGGNSEWNGSKYNNLNGTIIEIVRMRSVAEVTVDVGFQVKSMITSNSLEELGLREGEHVQVHFKKDALGISPVV
jgi:putative spermidine/putrescine transport system ATP-binding protein